MNISNMVIDIWSVQELSVKIKSNGNSLEAMKGQQLNFRAAHCLYLIHIPIQLHEDIMTRE